MSKLILPDYMPNFNNDDGKRQWLEGRATRMEVIQDVVKINERIDNEMQSVSMFMSRVYNMARVTGLQISTLERMLDRVHPNFKNDFELEFQKTIALVGFIDGLNGQGEHSQKPMKEKIQMVRDWNAQEEQVKVEGYQFGLDQYIESHKDEFTQEEVDGLVAEFKMGPIQLAPPVPILQVPVPAEEAAPVAAEVV